MQKKMQISAVDHYLQQLSQVHHKKKGTKPLFMPFLVIDDYKLDMSVSASISEIHHDQSYSHMNHLTDHSGPRASPLSFGDIAVGKNNCQLFLNDETSKLELPVKINNMQSYQSTEYMA